MAQEPWSSSISEISLSPPLSPADIADARAHQHSIDSHDDSALSDSAQNMFDSLTNRIQYELQHYRCSVQSEYTSEPDYLDVGTNTASNGTEQSPQDDDGEENDDDDSLSREPSFAASATSTHGRSGSRAVRGAAQAPNTDRDPRARVAGALHGGPQALSGTCQQAALSGDVVIDVFCAA
ncbi:hypothetical protein BG005_005476 [Podila minutissima]|nr:hypothetical protein BG005_005476 [Podila minutissima]